MNGEQVFVGGVSAVLGLICLFAAASNWNWFYQLPKAKSLDQRWGRGCARIAFAILAILLIMTGALIVFDIGPGWMG